LRRTVYNRGAVALQARRDSIMMRRLLLYLSHAGWARNAVTRWGFARRAARRFIAGETLDEAVGASRALNGKGLRVTLDCLGESVEHEDDTRAVVATYRALIERIEAEGLDASVSVKLTHLGLDIREALAVDNLRAILEAGRQHGVFVTIDMESSAYTERTLAIFRAMRCDEGFGNVGAVIQSYLYRSAADMERLAAEGATVRLCKGAYLEPAAVAFPAKADVDQSYAGIMAAYLQTPPPAVLQMATHDEKLIAQAEALIAEHQLPPDRYEFQMLYGIRSARQEALAAAGHPVRVYVPFGSAWYPYFMRRLAERPANLQFFLKAAVQG
jgi:proline dehydrogenase